MTTKKEIVMKQNELFNKYCENCDPKTREEVRKQMDRVLGRTALEKAAGDYIVQLNGEDLEGGFNAAFNAFKAGAKWQQKQGAKGYVLESASPVCKEDKPQRLITILYDETEDNYVRRGDDIIIQIKKL